MARSEHVDLLVFGAHADDVELSSGGTIITAIQQGQRVGIVDLTHGEMGTRGTPELRLRESRAAQKILGAAFRERCDFGDGQLRTGREEELVVIDLIRRHRPSLIIAPYPDDRHPDHGRAGRLVTEAAFYAGLVRIESGEKAHRPQAVIYQMMTYTVEPTLVVDVTKAWSRKMKAIAAYRSQFYNPASKERPTILSQKNFLDRIEGRARHFGSLIGAVYGEPFFSKQPPKVMDLISAFSGREVS